MMNLSCILLIMQGVRAKKTINLFVHGQSLIAIPFNKDDVQWQIKPVTKQLIGIIKIPIEIKLLKESMAIDS